MNAAASLARFGCCVATTLAWLATAHAGTAAKQAPRYYLAVNHAGVENRTGAASAGPSPGSIAANDAIADSPNVVPGAAETAAAKSVQLGSTGPHETAPSKAVAIKMNGAGRLSVARQAMARALGAQPEVTLQAALAKKLKLRAHSIDVGLLDYRFEYRGSVVIVSARFQVSLADERGKILSVFTKTVSQEVRRGKFHPARFEGMTRDLFGGVAGVLAKEIVGYLRRPV